MASNTYIEMLPDDEKALNLANTQLFALLVFLIGYLFLIKSSIQNRELIFRKYINYDTPAPDPLQTSLVGTKINLSAILLIIYVSFTRQRDLDMAFTNNLIGENIYTPSTDLTKVSIIGVIAILISIVSIQKIINAQTPNEPVAEEEFIF